MKNLLLFAACCLLAMSSCCEGKQSGFTLEGTIGELNAPAMLYLSYSVDGEEVRDSVLLDGGRFSFAGAVAEPVSARLILDHAGAGIRSASSRGGDVLSLFVDNETIRLQSSDSVKNSVITGSPINDENARFKAATSPDNAGIMAQVNALVRQATPEQQQDPAFRTELNNTHRGMVEERIERLRQFVRDNPNSFFSLTALSEASSAEFDADEVEPLFMSIAERHRNTFQGKAFARRIKAARALVIGGVAPDFTQNDPDGNPVSLSDLRGKYVLIDFWASWCGPCRFENPNLVKAYAAYHDKGFEILGVSLDNPNGREAWLQAIKDDNMTWVHVSDLRGWNNAVAQEYGIRAIPHTYLLDPQGVIIASNLRGEQFAEFLRDLFEGK